MDDKKYLFIYPNGGRGDFLASILIGDILLNTTGAVVISPGCGKAYYKTHALNTPLIVNNSTVPFDSFSNYVTIRIKVNNLQDATDIHKLAKNKIIWNGDVEAAFTYEKSFAPFDHLFNTVVPFRDLFNIEKIKSLFVEYKGREITADEQQRILNNIQLNFDILNSFSKQ